MTASPRPVALLVLILGIAVYATLADTACAQSSLPAPAVQQVAGSPPSSPGMPELETPPLPANAPSLVPLDREITLDEAMKIALANQPQLILARYAAEAARARVSEAASGLYPSFSASAAYTRTGPGSVSGGGASGGSVGGSYSSAISGQELIYDFGKTSGSVGQARSQAESAQQGLQQSYQDTINQVKQGYYTLLQVTALVGVQESAVRDQRAHLDLAKARFEAGVAPRADVARAEAALADAVLGLATAQNTAATARVNLNLALGVDVRTPTRIKESREGDLELKDSATIVEQALENRPAARQARADAEAARMALKVARATNRPDLILDGSYAWRGSSFPPSDRSWSYGLGLSWPFLNFGLTSGRIREAEANLRAGETRLRQTELSVGSEVVQAYLNVQTARQKVTTSESEVASAEESLRLATGRYQAGVGIYVEVLDAETAAITARTNLVNARYALSTSLAALRAALGTDTYGQESSPAGSGG